MSVLELTSIYEQKPALDLEEEHFFSLESGDEIHEQTHRIKSDSMLQLLSH